MNGKEIKLPERIRVLMGDKPVRLDEVGKSGSTVMMLERMVLKIEKASEKTDDAEQMLGWMQGKLPVPGILCATIRDGMHYLLMERIPGHMSCDEKQMENRDEVHALLAKGLRMLWDTDGKGCPVRRTLEDDLKYVRDRVQKKQIPPEEFYAEGFEKEAFETPEQLLLWLEENRPRFDPVLSHGDYCMPNVFFDQGRVSGMIDLGDAGVADRWRDIALCWGSLERNFGGVYGGKVYHDFDPVMLVDKLGIPMDGEKLAYYLRLNAMF